MMARQRVVEVAHRDDCGGGGSASVHVCAHTCRRSARPAVQLAQRTTDANEPLEMHARPHSQRARRLHVKLRHAIALTLASAATAAHFAAAASQRVESAVQLVQAVHSGVQHIVVTRHLNMSDVAVPVRGRHSTALLNVTAATQSIRVRTGSDSPQIA